MKFPPHFGVKVSSQNIGALGYNKIKFGCLHKNKQTGSASGGAVVILCP